MRDLAKNEDIETLLGQYDGLNRLFFNLLILSGRRQIDIARLRFENVKCRNGEKFAILERDKVNQNKVVSFRICWEDWNLKASCKEERLFMEKGGRVGLIFDRVEKQKISRSSKFRLDQILYETDLRFKKS